MNHFRSLLLLPLFTLLIACSGEPYPYPPQFVSIQDVPPQVLAAPPAPHSVASDREVDSILDLQAHLTVQEKKTIAREDHISPEMIVYPVLGKQYNAEHYPALYTLLKHASSDAWRISDTTEDYWNSPRPWVADSRVQLLVPSITRPGYPSGHTTTNTVWAYVLSELFPAKRDALFARAMEIGHHRIEGGAHFPHDVAGGRKIAGIIYGKMKRNPAFRQELAAARNELQKH